MKCLSNYDTLQHVTESSERFIFITDVCGICKGFFRGKTEHYFPNEIHSMVIYEAHLSLCKLWPLSEAAYPRAETGVSGGNELHSILQPKIYMFKPKLGKESAKLKTASSKLPCPAPSTLPGEPAAADTAKTLPDWIPSPP
ncbi:unnamed protein product [Natator depressus]